LRKQKNSPTNGRDGLLGRKGQLGGGDRMFFGDNKSDFALNSTEGPGGYTERGND